MANCGRIGFEPASFAGTADGNANPVLVFPSACTASAAPVVAGAKVDVIKNPCESNDLGPFVAAGSMVTTTGKPCWSYLVTTSRPDANDEGDPGEEGGCAGVGWESGCGWIASQHQQDRNKSVAMPMM